MLESTCENCDDFLESGVICKCCFDRVKRQLAEATKRLGRSDGNPWEDRARINGELAMKFQTALEKIKCADCGRTEFEHVTRGECDRE